MGSHQRMHTVIEPYCTGCGLCLPVCPVDCIVMEPVGEATGWQAWSPAQANEARDRYAARQVRLAADEQTRAARQTSELQAKLSDLAAHSHITDADALARKQTLVAAALAKARAKRSGAL
jgi:electron transport complex protein RnfB